MYVVKCTKTYDDGFVSTSYILKLGFFDEFTSRIAEAKHYQKEQAALVAMRHVLENSKSTVCEIVEI